MDQFRELLPFVESDRPDIRRIALEHLLSMSGRSEFVSLIREESLKTVTELCRLCADVVFGNLAVPILAVFSSDEDILSHILSCSQSVDLMHTLVERLNRYRDSEEELAGALLANLTRVKEGVGFLVKMTELSIEDDMQALLTRRPPTETDELGTPDPALADFSALFQLACENPSENSPFLINVVANCSRYAVVRHHILSLEQKAARISMLEYLGTPEVKLRVFAVLLKNLLLNKFLLPAWEDDDIPIIAKLVPAALDATCPLPTRKVILECLLLVCRSPILLCRLARFRQELSDCSESLGEQQQPELQLLVQSVSEMIEKGVVEVKEGEFLHL